MRGRYGILTISPYVGHSTPLYFIYLHRAKRFNNGIAELGMILTYELLMGSAREDDRVFDRVYLDHGFS